MVVHLDAGEADVAGMDGKLRAVEREHGVAVDEFRPEGVVAAELVDLHARVVGEVHRLLVHLASAEKEVFARDVERGEEQVGSGGGLRERDHLAHVVGVHGTAREQYGALRERAAGLVDGRGGHVAAGRHRGNGQLLVEVEVRTVRLIRQNAHPRRVGKLHDLHEVRADAVVGGVVHEHSLRGGMFRDRLRHVLDAHPERDAEALVRAGVHVHGNRAAHHERVDRAAVDVAGEDDLVARRTRGHDHRLHGGRCAVHHEERVVRAERLGRETLRVADHRDGVSEVVKRLHGVDVHRHRAFAEVFGQLGVAASALVRGHVEVREAVDPLRVKRIGERRRPLARRPCVFRPRRYGSCHLIDHLLSV